MEPALPVKPLFREVSLLISALLLSLTGCQPFILLLADNIERPMVAVTVDQTALMRDPAECSGSFVAHELPHQTRVPGGETVRMFEANGSGVAINDLDNDGDLDLVFGNHAGPNTIFWNYGEMLFRPELLGDGDSRAVTTVDIDGDGWQDILFSKRSSALNFWQNQRDGTFIRQVLPGVDKPLYAINWADLDRDGDLDLVGGTYDAELLTDLGQEFLQSNSAGVYLYENQGNRFVGSQLADGAQVLALLLMDLNQDQHLDIVVGNDFAVPDYAWVNTVQGWQTATPFHETTYSTMSFDQGDVNNDGVLDLFASDMKPYASDAATVAAWQPILESLQAAPRPDGDQQAMANGLQIAALDGDYSNQAEAWNVAATGWSWSGKFGDLDQDGLLDLYVVNGFIEERTFAHLPQHELAEANQAFRNNGRGRFNPMPAWGLGSTLSGRGMSMADLDSDGDLDIAVNNLRGRAMLFENQLCSGSSLQVDLRWPNSHNRYAIGATLILQTDSGQTMRIIQAASGYLSGDPARVHFGLLSTVTPQQLLIQWPDGARSSVALEGNADRNNVHMVISRE